MPALRKIFRKAPRNIITRSGGLMKKAAELRELGARVTLLIEVDGEKISLKSHYNTDVPYTPCEPSPAFAAEQDSCPAMADRQSPSATPTTATSQHTAASSSSSLSSPRFETIRPGRLFSLPSRSSQGLPSSPPLSWFDE